MNKQFIITALLALVAMAGLGQVKYGLDLCLRDELTGEWLIGLFDDYAVYDCDYWEYADIQKEPLIAQYWDWEQNEKNVPLTISVLNALDMDEASREILNRPLQSAP